MVRKNGRPRKAAAHAVGRGRQSWQELGQLNASRLFLLAGALRLFLVSAGKGADVDTAICLR
jgi:hypothetical protein